MFKLKNQTKQIDATGNRVESETTDLEGFVTILLHLFRYQSLNNQI